LAELFVETPAELFEPATTFESVATCALLAGLSGVCKPVCESLEVAISARPVSANVGELESEQPAIKASEAAIPKPTIFLLSIDINISPIRYYSITYNMVKKV
jgi:hypothetical protein